MKKLLLFVILASLAAGMIFGGGGREKAAGGITFNVALSEDIAAVDPGVAWNFVTNQVTNQITEGLLTMDANNNIVPELARSWRQLDDLTYVYEVRDDIVFSDGTKMTMDDVLFSFERAKDPDGGTYFSDFFADVESFSVTGWQFTIKLKSPSAVFKYIPAIGAGRIISKAYYEAHRDNFGTASGGIVATGPFVYESWTSGQEVVLKKNTNYWNKEKLSANPIDTLVYHIIPEDTTRVIALQNGSVDFCANLPIDMLDQLAADANLNMTTANSYGLTYLALNTDRAPMNDPNVRRAIYRALNIPEFQRQILKNAGTAGTILPFGEALYGENAAKWRQFLGTNAPAFSFDAAAAKQLLSRTAYANGFDCDLVVSENSLANQRALFIQESLKALNINVNIRRMSGEEQDAHQIGGVLDADGKRDYDMIIGGWESDYPDLNGNIEIMYDSAYAGEGYNAAAYINPLVDDMIGAQRAATNPARRFEIQSRLMETVMNEVPYIVFDYTSRHSVLNKKYSGLAVSPSWLWVLPMQNVRAAN